MSEEDALRLKARLDERVKARLSSSRRGSVFYWMAAAALLLLIGFSVIYVQQDPPQPQTLSFEDRREKVINDQISVNPPQQTVSEKEPVTENEKSGTVKEKTGSPERKISEPTRVLADRKEEPAPSTMSAADDAAFVHEAEQAPAAPMEIAAASEPAPLPAKMTESGKSTPANARVAITQGASKASPLITATYPGGNDSLCGQLRHQLAGTIARFTASVKIDRLGKVVKASVISNYKINVTETNRIEAAIEAVSGFSLSVDPGNAPVEYRFGCTF